MRVAILSFAVSLALGSGVGAGVAVAGEPPAVVSTAADAPDEPALKRPKQADVDAAVLRGVAWLRTEQKRSGDFGTTAGETALALLTLRHSGVPEDDKACRRAASYLERTLPDGTVYGAAIGLIALIAQDVNKHESKVRELASDLVGAQCKNGQWTYSYRSSGRVSAGDNSNTQFAIMALAAARVQRISVPAEPFERCLAFFERSQNEDGGYGYSEKQRSKSYASMTAGGAMALRLCAAVRAKTRVTDPKLDAVPEVKRALAWLGERFDPAKNSGAAAAFGSKKGRRSDSFWRHYSLWTVERACSTAGVEKLGTRAAPTGCSKHSARTASGGIRRPDSAGRVSLSSSSGGARVGC